MYIPHGAYSRQGIYWTVSVLFDVWVLDLEKRIPVQLTYQGTANHELAWARDSQHLIYGDGRAMWRTRADGSGQPQKLSDRMENPRPGSLSSNGPLAFSALGNGLPDVWTMPLDLSDLEHPKPGKPETFVNDATIVEVDPAFSPDGKFLAYSENKGAAEDVPRRQMASFGSRVIPAHEILYLGGDNRVTAASYTIQGDSFSPGALPFLLNFLDELQRRVPPK